MEELEETVESPVCDPLKEEGAHVIKEELHSDCSDKKNVKSSVGLDIGYITNEFPSQVEIEKYITSGHIPVPKQFPKDLNNQTFPERTLKFWALMENYIRETGLFGAKRRKHYIVCHVDFFGTLLVLHLQGLH